MNKITALLILYLLVSCTVNEQSLSFEVKIFDSLSKAPVPNARVAFLCWRKVDFDDETYEFIDTATDQNGSIRLNFKEGFKLDYASVANGYRIHSGQLQNLKGMTIVNIFLRRNSEAATTRGRLSLIARTHPDNRRSIQYFGLDILNMKSSNSRDSSDMYPTGVDGSFYPNELILPLKGGIRPFFEKLSDYEKVNAPNNEYFKKYKITGEEHGYFVLCRDGKTYARLDIIGKKFEKSVPDTTTGYYIERGFVFDVTRSYGGSNFNTGESADLEDYLLKRF